MDHPNAKWLVIGWGARDFYTSTGTYLDIRPRAVWRALTGDAAVMRVDLAGPLPDDLPTRSVQLSLSEYDALLVSIESGFARTQAGEPQLLQAQGFSDSDQFYAATGQFHLLETCNAWIGRKLRAAGLPFGWWTPTKYAVSLAHHMHLAP